MGYDKSRVSPFKFLVDQSTRNSGVKAPWRGEEINKTLEQLKADKMYDDEIIGKLEDKLRKKYGFDKRKDWEIDVTFYELYDRVNNKIIVICKDLDDEFMRNGDTPEGIDGDPYTTAKLFEIPGQWYPKPEISSGRQLQKDYQEGRAWQRDWAQKCNPQLGVKETFAAQHPEEVKKLGDGVTEVVRGFTSENEIFLIQKDMQHVNPGLEEHMALCEKDFDEIMGQSSQDRGLVGKAKLATEAQIAEQKGNVREQDKIMLVKTFFCAGIKNLLNLIKHNPDEPEEIRSILLSMKMDVEVDIESKTPKNRAIERKQLIESAQVFPPLASSPTYIDQLLRTFDIRERDKIMQEIMAASQPKEQKPEAKPISMSLPIAYELLDNNVHALINQLILQALQAQVPQGAAGNGGNGGGPTGQSPEAGTEGMSPGSGMAAVRGVG